MMVDLQWRFDFIGDKYRRLKVSFEVYEDGYGGRKNS
jgi:hypothetical protein